MIKVTLADIAGGAHALSELDLIRLVRRYRLPEPAVELVKLAHHHRDPFDRLLISQALAEQMQLVTNDSQIARYGINVVW